MTSKKLTKEQQEAFDAGVDALDKVFPTTAATTGTAIGSFVPGIGTGIGLAVGTGIGYALRLRNVMKNGFKKDEDDD